MHIYINIYMHTNAYIYKYIYALRIVSQGQNVIKIINIHLKP